MRSRHQSSSADPALPSRILDLTSSEESSGGLRLIDGSGKQGRYAVLTYCWGPKPEKVSKTTTDTLAQRMESIDLGQLSPLFRDAVQVCRYLEIPYLWIDALCIAQDCKNEWYNEARRMRNVYSDAFLTISAASAESPEERLLLPVETESKPDPQSVQPAAPIFKYEGGGKVLQLCALREVPSGEAESGVLSRRGWCLQERYLSRRTVHFTKSYTEWECLTKAQLEDRDVSASGPVWELLRPLGPDGFQQQVTDDKAAQNGEPYTTWYYLLADYSRRRMTYSTDRLAGILGLADLFAQATGDHLVGGLWASDLVRGMMW
ncbi:HET-domain-containing protein, partial [Cryphonectria parasitica EP155]